MRQPGFVPKYCDFCGSLVAGQRVGQESRQLFPGVIDLGSWRQSLIESMASRELN